jgi:hypothetical protein
MNIYVRVRINVSSFISYIPCKYKASKNNRANQNIYTNTAHFWSGGGRQSIPCAIGIANCEYMCILIFHKTSYPKS